jgi:hypothetical protein
MCEHFIHSNLLSEICRQNFHQAAELKIEGEWEDFLAAWCVFSARVLVMFQCLLPTSIKVCVTSTVFSSLCSPCRRAGCFF